MGGFTSKQIVGSNPVSPNMKKNLAFEWGNVKTNVVSSDSFKDEFGRKHLIWCFFVEVKVK